VSVTATRVGVVTSRDARFFTCTRCGMVRKVNTSRPTARDNYLCQDCRDVLSYTEKPTERRQYDD